MNCEKIFNYLVDELSNYLTKNNLKAMILGISGGIDSTVVAAICHEVEKKTGIPLIGRSLPSKYNKEGETTTAELVGKAFCSPWNFEVKSIQDLYENTIGNLGEVNGKSRTALANGNVQARLRMIVLYDIASQYPGIAMDTDNKTEHNLGYFTLHGDQGDYAPMRELWKTEVYKLAQFIRDFKCDTDEQRIAINESCALTPTAGLGITDSDLEELGAPSYMIVDCVLKSTTIEGERDRDNIEMLCGKEVTDNIIKRHKASEFKRRGLPIYPEISDFDK